MIKVCFTYIEFLNDKNLYDKMLLTLPEKRRKKAESLKFKNDALLSVASSLMLGECLKRIGLTFDDIEIYETKKGKMCIKGDSLYFSLSHSGSLAFCALSDKPIGIDVQKIKDYTSGISKKCFTDAESDFVCDTDSFFRVWTIKEAYAKLTGDGIASFKNFSVQLFPVPAISEDANCHITETELDGYKICVCAKVDDDVIFEEVNLHKN